MTVSVNVTLAVGSEFNTTLKLSLTLPFSLTVALVPDRLKPTVSLSVVVMLRLSDSPL